MNTEIENIAMIIIANAGEARSLSFEALKLTKEKKYDEAEILLKKSDEAAHIAHQAQTELLIKEANGEKSEFSILLIHAQDHLMTAMLGVELIKEMIEIVREK